MLVYGLRNLTISFSKHLNNHNCIYKKYESIINLSFQTQFIPNANYCVNKRDSTILSKVPFGFPLVGPKEKIKNAASQLVNSSISYMEEISHLDEVRQAQANVMLCKDNLKEYGDLKRKILFELNSIRNDIQKNHNEIASSMRGTERYITLVKEEMNLLNSEIKKQNEFNAADEIERQLFNSLSAAINDSNEKEKIHSNFIKILGIIGTLAASIVTLIVSAIGHFYHNTKFGLVARDFKENVNQTIKTEVGQMSDKIQLEILHVSQKHEKLLKQILRNNDLKKRESWSEFIKRYAYNIYSYFIPVKNK